MKAKYKLKMFSFITAVFFAVCCLNQASVNTIYAASAGPELLITEVMPMSETTDDAYEYIELYNNTDRNIDLKDYKLPLQNIDITASKNISPKGVLVICLTGSTTLDRFNTFYGTAITQDKYITLPFVNEVLDNSSNGSIVLAKDDGTVVSRAQYISTDFQVKKSVTYKYPEAGFDMARLGQNQNPTPGSVTYDQVPQNGTKVTGVTLNSSFLVMGVNQTAVLYDTVAPATACNQSVIWTSDNSNVVEVSQNGILKSKALGIAHITVSTVDGGFTAVCAVYVGRVPVTGIKLNIASLSVGVGQAVILTASVTPENATNKSMTWKSSDTNVATVDSNGIVIGKAAGKAAITATTADGNYSAVCNITVYDVNNVIRVTGISLDKTETTLTVGKVIILEAKITPLNATNKQVTWTSSNNSVAAVDYNSGIVIAKGPGTSWITAVTNDGGYRAYCKATVTYDNSSYIPVSNIELNTNVLEMTKGQNKKLTAAISPANATNKSVTWSSDNTSAASVDKNGNVSALNKGIAVITAKTADGNLKDRCFVIVRDDKTKDTEVLKIRLNKTSICIRKGKFEKLTPIITPGDLKNTALIWKSSNSKVAYVTNDGKVFGINNGNAVITVSTKDGKHTATCKVQVTNGKGPGNGNGKAKGH